MCYLTEKTKFKSRTGYKVLAEKNGKFYSTFTGQELKVGKVPLPPKHGKRLSNEFWNRSIDSELFRELPFYRSDFVGKTSIFTNKKSCKHLYSIMKREEKINDKFNLVMVKMVISENIHKGYFIEGFLGDSHNVFAGENINSIEVIL